MSVDLLPPVVSSEIAHRSVGWTYASGDLLIAQGNVSDSLIVILQGEVEVTFRRASGHMIPLAHLGSKEIVGEIGLLMRTRRTAQVRATTSVHVQLLPRAEYYFLDEAFPSLRSNLGRIALSRLRVEGMTRSTAKQYGEVFWNTVCLGPG